VTASTWHTLPGGQKLELVHVADVPMEPVDWIWPGYLPLGKLANCSGDPGVSKSTLSVEIAARVTRGDAMPDGTHGVLYGRPSGVVLIAGEDGIGDTIKPRIAAAGGNPDLVYVLRALKAGEKKRLVNLTDLAAIQYAVELTNARLFIVDPLMASMAGVKTNDDQAIRTVLMPIVDIASRLDFGGLVISHFNKASDITNALYRNASSMGLMATYRSAFMVAEDPNNPGQSILAHVKGNLSERPPKSLVYARESVELAEGITAPRIRWMGESDYTHITLLAAQASKSHGKGSEGEDKMSKQEAAEFFLRTGLRDGPVPSDDIEKWREAARISKNHAGTGQEGTAYRGQTRRVRSGQSMAMAIAAGGWCRGGGAAPSRGRLIHGCLWRFGNLWGHPTHLYQLI
jgi:hypothetical protein